MPIEFLISALVTLLVVVDPIGLVPSYLAVTHGLPQHARRSVALHAALIAAAILITRRSSLGRGLAVALGAYGLGMALWRLPSMLPAVGPHAGAGPVALLLIVGSVWAAHVFAAACVLSLRGAWPLKEGPQPQS